MLSSVLSAIPVLEPIIVRIMQAIRPDASVACETVNAIFSACTYVPTP